MSLTEDVPPRTIGLDHVGLSVRDLEGAKSFFCEGLGWRVVGERNEYPAAFVSDGASVLTLWQVQSPSEAPPFDRRANVGLHHLAIAVADREGFEALHRRLAAWPNSARIFIWGISASASTSPALTASTSVSFRCSRGLASIRARATWP